jgi:hypothetical protein
MAGHSRSKGRRAFARLCPGHPHLPRFKTAKTWMPGTRPGMTNERLGLSTSWPGLSRPSTSFSLVRLLMHFFLIHFSNSQASSPVLFGEAPGRPVVLSLTSRQKRGGWRAKWRNLSRETRERLSARQPDRLYAVWLICGRLPYGTGPRFLLASEPCRPSVSQLLAGGSYWPPGGAPVPPGCVLCVSIRAGAASGSTIRRL